jgi:hypothetical protein
MYMGWVSMTGMLKVGGFAGAAARSPNNPLPVALALPAFLAAGTLGTFWKSEKTALSGVQGALGLEEATLWF